MLHQNITANTRLEKKSADCWIKEAPVIQILFFSMPKSVLLPLGVVARVSPTICTVSRCSSRNTAFSSRALPYVGSLLTLLELQFRLGDKALNFQVKCAPNCPRNETAVQKGELIKIRSSRGNETVHGTNCGHTSEARGRHRC